MSFIQRMVEVATSGENCDRLNDGIDNALGGDICSISERRTIDSFVDAGVKWLSDLDKCADEAIMLIRQDIEVAETEEAETGDGEEKSWKLSQRITRINDFVIRAKEIDVEEFKTALRHTLEKSIDKSELEDEVDSLQL